MPKKSKTILSYTLLFFEAIVFLFITILAILKFTLLNDSYIRNILTKNHYYEDLYNEILTEMSYYTNQSGFEDDILKDTFSLGEIKFETNKFIDSLYKGKSRKVETKELNEKLEKNINEFIANSGFEYVDKKEIKDFINTMDEVYENEIKLMGYADKIAPKFYKVIRLSNSILLVLIIAFIILFIINHIVLKSTNIAVLPFFSSFSLTFSLLYLNNNIDFKNLFIYSSLVSNIFQKLIKNLYLITTIVIIIYIVIVFLFYIFKKKKKSY